MNYTEQIRRGLGAVPFGAGTLAVEPNMPPLAPPSSPDAVAIFNRNAFALQTVESAARSDAKLYGIAAAVAFSLGASVALSAEDRNYKVAGAVVAGAGVAGGAIALRSHLRAQEAGTLKNRYVRALVAGGQSSSIPITEGL